tara:strand:- start:362 stop:808 length:447 start_codon:yes stop_codon:yes gene_type:complete
MKTTKTHIMKNLTQNNTQIIDGQAVTSRLEQLTTVLRDQEWIEFEFESFMFWQFCDALLGKRVHLVNGAKQNSITMSQINQMDALTTEFSLLFCKSELRKTISAMNENEKCDGRLHITTHTRDFLSKKRNGLNDNILLIEDKISNNIK